MKKPNLRKLAGAILVGFVIPSASFAAATIYLKIEGVNGEVIAKGYEKTIEVQAVSWGMNRVSQNGNGMMVKPCTQVSALELTKPVDTATPVLMTNVVSGMVFPKAKLSFLKQGGAGVPAEFMSLEMNNVTIASLAEATSSGEDQPVENVALKFSSATFSYKPQDNKTGAFLPAVTSTFKAGAC